LNRKKKRKGKIHTRDWERLHDEHLAPARPYEEKEEDEAPVGDPAIEPNATLLAHSGQWAWVQYDGREILCRIDERAVKRHSAALAAGDAARVEWEGGEPFLKGVAPRRTKLSRRLPDGREQVVAANIDKLVIVSAAAKPRFKAGVIDRYLIAADVGGVEPVICINKMDLVEAEPAPVQVYRELGIPVIDTSAVTGQGLDDLREQLRGKLSVLAGQSGVGKSTLINALDPRHDVEVQPVSEHTEKGKHTTRRARLYELEGDIRIIDTPGVRQMAVHGVTPEEIDLYFPEIAELAANCKFRDCSHAQEPGCAVRTALESGELPSLRYKSYLRIRDSVEELEEY
jgi:ribosome biogenesis GTPase